MKRSSFHSFKKELTIGLCREIAVTSQAIAFHTDALH